MCIYVPCVDFDPHSDLAGTVFVGRELSASD